jgi:uncharacterized NAD(P)/FAD-binding protein YdhS
LVYDVVVVGAGFSAIAVTINLVGKLPPSASIAIIGDDPGFGRGTAYRTELYLHRLNVPAGRMSVFPDRPNDFVDWLTRRGRPLQAGDFASRRDYGLYLRDTLASLLRNRSARCRVDFIKAKATGCVERFRVGLAFTLDNTAEILGKNVVLCLGVGNASLPMEMANLGTKVRKHIVDNPWRLSWLQRVKKFDSVCILGSGLTMIDQVLALRAHGHEGRIQVLSRRGLIPLAHARDHPPAVEPILPTGQLTMSALLQSLRRQAKACGDWRALMDGMRPGIQAVWQRLDKSERARFLRHALPWWNIHRHRIPSDVSDRLQAMLRDATLEIHAGYLTAVAEDGNRLALTYRLRGRQQIASLQADWLVNCTGMERAGIRHSPLLQEMQRQGLIAADPLGLGIDVDRTSQIIGSDGQRQPGVYAVGALTAGQFWEITAVPDIRVQAKNVSALIAEEA